MGFLFFFFVIYSSRSFQLKKWSLVITRHYFLHFLLFFLFRIWDTLNLFLTVVFQWREREKGEEEEEEQEEKQPSNLDFNYYLYSPH